LRSVLMAPRRLSFLVKVRCETRILENSKMQDRRM
jgi:hypothetical protein